MSARTWALEIPGGIVHVKAAKVGTTASYSPISLGRRVYLDCGWCGRVVFCRITCRGGARTKFVTRMVVSLALIIVGCFALPSVALQSSFIL